MQCASCELCCLGCGHVWHGVRQSVGMLQSYPKIMGDRCPPPTACYAAQKLASLLSSYHHHHRFGISNPVQPCMAASIALLASLSTSGPAFSL